MAKDKGTTGAGSKARKQIEKAMQKAEKDKVLQSARRRLEVAMVGVKANEEHRYLEAVKHYQHYLHVLEEVKGVGENGLIPSSFNIQNEMGEILLLVGVYWDLAKIYDRTKTPDRYRDFKNYLDKFMLFTRGMPHEPVCREMLRKYLRRERPKHGREFRDAYRSVSKDKCFIAGALIDVIDEETMPRLREFRDTRLSGSAPGRAFIFTYYRLGPIAASLVERLPLTIRQSLGKALDHLAKNLR